MPARPCPSPTRTAASTAAAVGRRTTRRTNSPASRPRPPWPAWVAATRSWSPTSIRASGSSTSALAAGSTSCSRPAASVPAGRAIGLDMTDEMLALAQRNAAEAGATNVEFLKGQIEAIPLPANSVDVVISNCVIDLAADKPAVFREIARVLRPGGRMGVSGHRGRRCSERSRASGSGDPSSAASPVRSRSASTKRACARRGSRTSRSRRRTRRPRA